MIKRIFAAACALGFASTLWTPAADARSYDGVSNGQGGYKQSHRSQRRGGGGSASRSCLTSAAQALLGRIEAQFGSIQLVSTCRPGARVAGSGRVSRHASGNAIDFNAGGRKGAVVQWLIANHASGGTMTYRGMSHIHVDVGPRFVSLGSGGGRRYASRSRGRGTYAAAGSRRTYASASGDDGDYAREARSGRSRRSGGDGPDLARTQFDPVVMR